MTITIPDELDEFVQAKIQTGEFATPAAVVVAALAAWQGQESSTSIAVDDVENRLLEAVDSPRTTWKDDDLDQIVDSLKKRYGA